MDAQVKTKPWDVTDYLETTESRRYYLEEVKARAEEDCARAAETVKLAEEDCARAEARYEVKK